MAHLAFKFSLGLCASLLGSSCSNSEGGSGSGGTAARAGAAGASTAGGSGGRGGSASGTAGQSSAGKPAGGTTAAGGDGGLGGSSDPIGGTDGLGEAGSPAAGSGGRASGSVRRMSREVYRDRLIALWLGESIANWTGLLTEGQKTELPFYTDDDWGEPIGNGSIEGSAEGVLEFNFMDPWGSDDDTDIEFIYLWTMFDRETTTLSPSEIRDAWEEHTEPGRYIWVSNLVAQSLMRSSPSVLPPGTSLFAANDQSLMIDAQLTTEIFGALAPGMPAKALAMADLPILTTASGYAAHAAQFFVALHSLAPISDASLAARDRISWLVRSARRLIPDQSKTADVIDFVLDDHASNPNPEDWERTRDRLAERFQENASDNDYRYLEWYESSVNLGTGVMALLYGEGDFRRTVQIGTLSGWDSDNGTATMGGLLGLLNGTEYLENAFPGQALSMEYFISRTRANFDPGIVSFEAIADRMLHLVELAIEEAGGSVTADGDYELPPVDVEMLDSAVDNPRSIVHGSSANNAAGTAPESDISGGEPGDASADDAVLVDGLEFDFSGRDRQLWARNISEFEFEEPEVRCIERDVSEEDVVTLGVTWSKPLRLAGLRFVEGPGSDDGGWLEDPVIQAEVDGTWTTVATTADYVSRPEVAFEIHELSFTGVIEATGIRLRGAAGGSGRYVTACELDGILAP